MRATMRLVLLLVTVAAGLKAQSTTAQITGRVSDPSGAVIPGALITVANVDTGVKRQTESNELGHYAVPLLPPGTYRVTVQKEGFRPVTRTGITLQVDQVARVDFVLEVGAVTETVEVSAAAPLLEQDSSSLGQVIDSSRILNMPLNGRMVFRLVQLTPGVLAPPGAKGQFGDISVGTFDDVHFSINGGRAQSNEVLIDGVPATTGFLNLFTTVPSVEATQEFKVQSNNLSAEWGRFGGGVINVSTRSGTNQLRGSLFEFLRNSALDANEFFNKGAGKAKPPFRMNQFGGAVGGPLLLGKLYSGRSRTFFFSDYQGTRWRRGDVFITTVPTALQREGDFTQTFNTAGQRIIIYDPMSTRADPARPGQFLRDAFPGNVLPVSRLDPAGRNLIRYYPLENTTGDPITRVNNYVSNAARRINKDEGSIRLDHNLTAGSRIFGRLAVTRNFLHQPDHFGNEATPGVGANGDIIFHYYTGTLDQTVTLTPSALFGIRYGFARFYWSRKTRSYGFDQTKLGLPASIVSQFQIPVFPSVSVEGYSAMAGGSFLTTGQDTHSLLPSLSKTTGRSNLKLGADLRLRRNNLWVISAGGGTYSFGRAFTRGPDPNRFYADAGNAIASLLLGTAGSGSVNITPGVSLQNWYLAGYVQDDVHLTSRLTLNLGLRYETESPYTERRNQLAWFDFDLPSPARNAVFANLTGGLRFVGLSGYSRHAYKWDTNNFGPRVGLAYSLTATTVLRAGAGLFYAPLETNNNLNTYTPVNGTGFAGQTPMVASLDGLRPFNVLSNPFPQGLVKPTGSAVGAAAQLGQAVTVWNHGTYTPYTLQWNADLQRQFWRDLLLDVSYAASRGVKLAQGYEFNALHPRELIRRTGLQQLTPNPFAGTITVGALAEPRVALRQLLLPYPQFTSVFVINDARANSVYHSLQLKLEKRMTQGLTFLVSYTAGKLISDAYNALATLGVQNNTPTGVQNWYDLRAERSLSEMDIAQNLAISYVLELPFGPGKRFASANHSVVKKLIGSWQLGGVFGYSSGFPLALSAPVVGGGNRPNSTGKSARIKGSRPRGQAIERWFDVSQFTLPEPFTFGNVARTLPDVRGPSLINADLSLSKQVRIAESLQLQVRCDAFNVANRPHFWQPNTAFGSLQFGRITSTQITALPRVIQFAAKLSF